MLEEVKAFYYDLVKYWTAAGVGMPAMSAFESDIREFVAQV